MPAAPARSDEPNNFRPHKLVHGVHCMLRQCINEGGGAYLAFCTLHCKCILRRVWCSCHCCIQASTESWQLLQARQVPLQLAINLRITSCVDEYEQELKTVNVGNGGRQAGRQAARWLLVGRTCPCWNSGNSLQKIATSASVTSSPTRRVRPTTAELILARAVSRSDLSLPNTALRRMHSSHSIQLSTSQASLDGKRPFPPSKAVSARILFNTVRDCRADGLPGWPCWWKKVGGGRENGSRHLTRRY